MWGKHSVKIWTQGASVIKHRNINDSFDIILECPSVLVGVILLCRVISIYFTSVLYILPLINLTKFFYEI
jgi:hypothetical protein